MTRSRHRVGFADRNVMENSKRSGLLRLDICSLDHLAPFLRFVADPLADGGGRPDNSRGAKFGKSALDPRIGEGRIDLPIELVDYLRRRVLGRADGTPRNCLVTWQQLSHGG